MPIPSSLSAFNFSIINTIKVTLLLAQEHTLSVREHRPPLIRQEAANGFRTTFDIFLIFLFVLHELCTARDGDS